MSCVFWRMGVCLYQEGDKMSNKLGDKLCTLRRERGLSQKELAEILQNCGIDVTNQAVSKWEKGITQPSATQFLTLCSIFEVDNIGDEFSTGTNGILHGLNVIGQRKVREYADILRASGLFRDEEKKAGRILPLYSLAVSAGTGQFLDSSDYEDVEVGDEVPASADFGVRIAGDSMEPMYHDGQTVWVSKQETLGDGEIGVFMYDDNAYLKQLIVSEDGVYLRSKNPDYGDIKINAFSELRVLGRAL